MDSLKQLRADVSACVACPRLVEWRESVAVQKRASFRDDEYWGKGVPGFGDPDASVWVMGLAPAAHGANRTGRMFTGDRSGDWLYRAMHRAGLGSQETSVHANDGLTLHGAWVSSAVRCAPPDNKPTPEERDTCRGFLQRERELLTNVRVVVCLGSFAYEAVCKEWECARDQNLVTEWKSPRQMAPSSFALFTPASKIPLLANSLNQCWMQCFRVRLF